ncbi:hypothetical protein [Streptomyces sp. NPDC088157]|uniref:hypothetical protein n=1 Tax=Streptomyces sp. NPDC088157 TaxID=3365832 RepID=UPI00382C6187
MATETPLSFATSLMVGRRLSIANRFTLLTSADETKQTTDPGGGPSQWPKLAHLAEVVRGWGLGGYAVGGALLAWGASWWREGRAAA